MFVDFVAVALTFLIPGTSPNEVQVSAWAALMGTAYTLFHRSQAKIVGFLIWTIGGIFIAGIYPLVLHLLS